MTTGDNSHCPWSCPSCSSPRAGASSAPPSLSYGSSPPPAGDAPPPACSETQPANQTSRTAWRAEGNAYGEHYVVNWWTGVGIMKLYITLLWLEYGIIHRDASNHLYSYTHDQWLHMASRCNQICALTWSASPSSSASPGCASPPCAAAPPVSSAGLRTQGPLN